MFSGFTSRCSTRWPCAWASPCATSRITRSAVVAERRARRYSARFVLARSVAIVKWPSTQSALRTATTLRVAQPRRDARLLLDRRAPPLLHRRGVRDLERDVHALDEVARLPDVGERPLPEAAVEPVLAELGALAEDGGQREGFFRISNESAHSAARTVPSSASRRTSADTAGRESATRAPPSASAGPTRGIGVGARSRPARTSAGARFPARG